MSVKGQQQNRSAKGIRGRAFRKLSPVDQALVLMARSGSSCVPMSAGTRVSLVSDTSARLAHRNRAELKAQIRASVPTGTGKVVLRTELDGAALEGTLNGAAAAAGVPTSLIRVKIAASNNNWSGGSYRLRTATPTEDTSDITWTTLEEFWVERNRTPIVLLVALTQDAGGVRHVTSGRLNQTLLNTGGLTGDPSIFVYDASETGTFAVAETINLRDIDNQNAVRAARVVTRLLGDSFIDDLSQMEMDDFDEEDFALAPELAFDAAF